MIKAIMLQIYSTFKLDAIKIYVIIYHMIKLIMLYAFIWSAVQIINEFYIEVYVDR